MQHRRFRKLCLTSAVLGAFSPLALAGTDSDLAAAPAASDSPASGKDSAVAHLETVTIVADQREVDLQDAAASVSALSSSQLEEANIGNAEDLNGYVPGLQISKGGGSERMISIRGIGSQTPSNFFTQPGVSFHIDGAYITNAIALNMGFLDVDHVEVQRGPQGTVFGAASTGGTINVISKRPAFGIFGGEIESGVGNYNYKHGMAAVNVPVGDDLAFRAVVDDISHDGYTTATGIDGGYGLDDANNTNARISGLWQPTDDVTVLLTYQRYYDRHHGPALKSVDDPDPDPQRVSQDFPAKFAMDMDVVNAIVTWDLPFATFKSTSSYQNMDVAQSYDADRSDYENYGGYDHVATWSTWGKTYTQEFTLASNPGGFIDWVGGVFLLKSDSNELVVEYSGTDPSDPMPILATDTDPSTLPDNLQYATVSNVKRFSWAPFAQGTLNFTDDLRLVLGYRYNDDDYDGWGNSYFAGKAPVDFGSQTSTGKAVLQYDLAPDNMVYASLSRGYKPGGVNPGADGAMLNKPSYKAEIVTAYELGSKNRLLNGDLTMNLAGFYYQYQDMQYVSEDPIPYHDSIGNVPKANVWGAELESTWLTAQDHLQLALNLSWLDGEFPEHYSALGRRAAVAAGDAALADGSAPYAYSDEWYAARAAAAIDVKGNTPPNLADYTGTAAATWFQDIGSYGRWTTRLEYKYRGKYQATIFNDPDADPVGSYWQANLYSAYQPDGEPWRIWLTVTNLTDRDGISGRFIDPYGVTAVSNDHIDPRQFIANFSYSF